MHDTTESSFAALDTFDAASETWTLRSHAAVREALTSAALAAGNEPATDDGVNAIRGAMRGTMRGTMRAAARDAFPSSRLSALRATLEASAEAAAIGLHAGTPVDLMRDFAEPWAHALALDATRMAGTANDAARLIALARTIFIDAAVTTTGEASATALDAAAALARALAPPDRSHTIDVQAFVALSQTLPHLLAAAWHALLMHADQIRVWRALGDKSGAVDELLRFAGPSRAVFRRARSNARIGACAVEVDQRLVLMLADANRDPLVFRDANRLDLARDASQHVAFGTGSHVCVGKPIVSLALEVATTALLDHVGDASTVHAVQWLDGFAIRAPASLVVRVVRARERR
jgi:cytochrome P450